MQHKIQVADQTIPLGLFELDRDETIIYHSGDKQTGAPAPCVDFVGNNFFRVFPVVASSEAFHSCYKNFKANNEEARSINFTLDCDGASVSLRVLLARISERTHENKSESLLVHFKKA